MGISPLKLFRVGTVTWYDVPEINTNFKNFSFVGVPIIRG